MKAHTQRWKEVSGAPHVSQPAIRTPSPMSDDWVNETGDADAIKKIADKPGATDHGAGGDGRAGIGESELENPDGQKGDTGTLISRRRVLQEEPVIADKSVAVAKHEGK